MRNLTTQERCVIDTLAGAWNQFLRLKRLHPDEVNEFRAVIHQAQAQIMARPAQTTFNWEKKQ